MSQQQFVLEHFCSLPALLSSPSIYLHTFLIFNQKKKIGTKGEDNEKTVLPILVCCVLP